MKKILSFSLLLFSFLQIFAQTPPYLKWAKCFGGSGDESGVLTNIGPSLTRTLDNYILITGNTLSNDGDIGFGNQKGDGDIFLIKIDTSGNIIWKKNYGGSYGDGGCNTYILPDSNYILIGNTLSPDGDITGAKNRVDVIVIKINKDDGSVIWSKNYGGSFNETPYCAVVDNNSITIACSTNSSDIDIVNRIGSVNNYDIWIFKINFNGTIIWQKPFNGTGKEFPLNIIKSNGNYFIIGSATSLDMDFADNHGLVDTWLAKLDNNGNLIWKKCVGGSDNDYPATIINLVNGNFLALMTTSSRDGDAATSPTNHSKFKMFYEFKDDGTKVGVHFNGNDLYADAYDIIQRSDSTFILEQNGSNDSLFISFMDAAYNINSRISYGASTSNQAAASPLLITPYDDLYGIKQTKATTGQITGNHGGYDFWVLKIKLPPVKYYPPPPPQPSRPYNLVCVTNVKDFEIDLTWQDSAYSNNRRIWIYRCMDDTSNFQVIDSVFSFTKSYNDLRIINTKRYFYKVAGVNNQGMKFSNICESRMNAGIDLNQNQQLQIVPNPFQGELILRNPMKLSIDRIEIYDINGKRVYLNEGNQTGEINIQTDLWSSGIYFLKLTTSDQHTSQWKIFKD